MSSGRAQQRPGWQRIVSVEVNEAETVAPLRVLKGTMVSHLPNLGPICPSLSPVIIEEGCPLPKASPPSSSALAPIPSCFLGNIILSILPSFSVIVNYPSSQLKPSIVKHV